MKILFLTTINSDKQGDYLEISTLHGLRTILGNNCVDFPRKKIMYHDFSDSPKNSLHGKGFSLLTTPIKDIPSALRENISLKEFDVIIYGDGHMYNEYPNFFDGYNIWIIDGHDLYGDAPRKIYYDNEYIIGTQYNKSFKRELIETNTNFIVYPTGFGIPEERILDLDFSIKTQLYQKTAPSFSLFEQNNELGGGNLHHKFNNEKEYYEDLKSSWFGLTCKKGGWDCLRHYEILAAGALLLFRDYNKKPLLCSPQNLPCFSYSSKDELYSLMENLVVNNIPTKEYISMLELQRKWLIECGTTVARAKYILKIISESMKNE